MKELEIQFEGSGEVSGMTFTQVQKSEKAFMYKLTDSETGKIHFEVFEKRVQEEGEVVLGGQVVKYEEKELYPKSNSFGAWAWCFTDHEKACVKFNELSN